MRILATLIALTALSITLTPATAISTQIDLPPHAALSTTGTIDKDVLLAISQPMQNTPAIPTPAGYGRYCSIMYASGAWAFAALPGAKSDPCRDLLNSTPGGTIMRLGLWSVNGENNVMLRCEGGGVGLWRQKGDAPINDAYKSATGQRSCIFVVSPARLPIFSAPYSRTNRNQMNIHADVRVTNTHNYNPYQLFVNVSDFGQTPSPNHTHAHTVDRKGRQLCRQGTTFQECCPNAAPGTMCRVPCHLDAHHGGYDWVMPEGKPLHAVAAGRVIMSRPRPIRNNACGNLTHERYQNEIFIRHTVGSDGYVESFLTYYAHLSRRDVETGDIVTAGQKIGEAGDTGCSSQSHLHFGVAKLSNTSGFLEYRHETTDPDCGDNSFPVAIDPYGWAAPRGIDPFAWLALGKRQTPCINEEIINPGAFSINLWRVGAAPPNRD